MPGSYVVTVTTAPSVWVERRKDPVSDGATMGVGEVGEDVTAFEVVELRRDDDD